MEGELWKWTNYWNGWQSRWFILDQGILSYYKSLEEVEQGCKGSLNVSACEISLHPTDSLRLDLAIPGEQHMYVRANTEKARQQWLVALGSAKACLSNQKHTSPPSSYSSAAEQSTRAKKAELRLYCDLLMQQVHNIKQAVQLRGEINLEQLDEGSYMLTQTCDTFITALDDLMVLSQVGAVGQGVATPVQNGVGGVDNRGRKHSSMERTCPGMVTSVGHNRTRCRTVSTDSVISAVSNMSVDEQHSSAAKRAPAAVANVSSSRDQDGFGAVFGSNFQAPPPTLEKEVVVDQTPSSPRFLAMEYSLPFKRFFPSPTTNSPRKCIPTQEFLDASAEVIMVFDMLDPKAFAPLKLDVLGHIQCLRTKLSSDPSLYAASLESIVTSELSGQQAGNINSGSKALLWLARSLVFVNVFLRRLIEMDSSAEESLEDCLAGAYEETLMEHHGLVVRSVFSVAMKRAPSRSAFLLSLGLPSEEEDVEEQKFFQAKMVPKLAAYLDLMEQCLTVIIELFKGINIETN